jgi:hypothetical protein
MAQSTATKNNTKIFRYKLSDDILSSITQFAKIHQLDDRHTYKEAWTRWLAQEEDSVEREVSRLQQLNYQGDVVDKMFKAGRYYFREKDQIQANAKANDTDLKKHRREYIVMDQALLQSMDTHLRGLIANKDFTPALAYKQFCLAHSTTIHKEKDRLTAQHITGEKIEEKVKKTYKNRYFILQKQLHNTGTATTVLE